MTSHDHDNDDQRIENAYDRRRDEPFPLEQVADVKHAVLPEDPESPQRS